MKNAGNPYSITPGSTACPKCGAVYVGVREVCSRCGASLKGGPHEIPAGSIIDDKYEVLGLLGAGGMGEVYKTRHIHLNAIRCIKVMKKNLLSDESFRSRFLREARVATQIQHPNIAVLHDFSTLEDGSYYMVWEYIDGVTVRQWSSEHGRFPVDFALEIVLQVLAGLDHCHRRGLLHRDMSGDNLMIANAADELLVKIIDLGIAKMVASPFAESTQVGMFVGNPKYSSPEQLGELEDGEELDGRSDLYSLGVVLYEMLLGVPLFKSRTPHGYIGKHLMEAPLPFGQVDPAMGEFEDLQQILFKVLEKDRANRYANAKEFAQALRKYLLAHEPDVGERVSNTGFHRLKKPTSNRPITERKGEGTVVKPIVRTDTDDQRAWEIGSNLDTLEGYEYFLQRFPNSPRAAQARARLDSLLLDRVHAFEQRQDLSGLNDLIAAHPESSIVGAEARAARARVDEYIRQTDIEALESDWQYCDERGTSEVWRWFLRTHPTSEREPEARERLAEASDFEKAAEEASPGSLQSFIMRWPDGPHAADVRTLIGDAEATQENSAFAAAKASLDSAALRKFLETWPSSAHAENARQLIAETEAYEKAAAANDARTWQGFIDRHPASERVNDARQNLNALEKERVTFNAAVATGSSKALEAFMEQHLNSPLRESAGRLLIETYAFEKAAANGVAGWDDYLSRYGDGRFATTARNERQRLATEAALQKARHDDTLAGWRKLSESHSAISSVAQEARRRIEELEEAAYNLMLQAGSIERGSAFLENFPASRHRSEVEQIVVRLQAGNAAASYLDHAPASIDSTTLALVSEQAVGALISQAEAAGKREHLEHLAQHSKQKKVRKAAAAAVERLRSREDAEARERHDWALAEGAASVSGWTDFLRAHPQSARADEAKSLKVETERLETVIKSGSVTQLRQFLASSPTEAWRMRALARVEELERDRDVASAPPAARNSREESTQVINRAALRAVSETATPVSDVVAAVRRRSLFSGPRLAMGVAAVLLIAIGVMYIKRVNVVDKDDSFPKTGGPVITSVVTSPLVIDARPWAEIVAVLDENGKEHLGTQTERYTPLVLHVPPGRYSVTLLRRDLGKRQAVQATVIPSAQTVCCDVEFRPIDADDYFKTIGWK